MVHHEERHLGIPYRRPLNRYSQALDAVLLRTVVLSPTAEAETHVTIVGETPEPTTNTLLDKGWSDQPMPLQSRPPAEVRDDQ